MRALCWLGFHRWKGMPRDPTESAFTWCRHCGKPHIIRRVQRVRG